MSLAGSLAGGGGEAVASGDPDGVGVEEGLAGQAGAVDEGLSHGDEEEPLSVSYLLVYVVGGSGGRAGDEGVELAEDLLAVVLLGGGGGFSFGLGLGFVIVAFVVTVAPAEESGAGIVVGVLPKDGVGPALSGALDESLEAVLERVLVEDGGGLRRRRRWPYG